MIIDVVIISGRWQMERNQRATPTEILAAPRTRIAVQRGTLIFVIATNALIIVREQRSKRECKRARARESESKSESENVTE